MEPLKALAVAWKAKRMDLSAYTAAGFQAAVDCTSGYVLLQCGIGPWMKALDVTANAPATAVASDSTAAVSQPDFNASRMNDGQTVETLVLKLEPHAVAS